MPILPEVSVVFIYMWSAEAELITAASFAPKCILKLEILQPNLANIQVLSTTSLPRELVLLIPVLDVACGAGTAPPPRLLLGCGYPAGGVIPVGRAGIQAAVLHFGSETGLDEFIL